MSALSNVTYFCIEIPNRCPHLLRIFLYRRCYTAQQLYQHLLQSRRTRNTILRKVQQIRRTYHGPLTINHALFTIPLTLHHETCDRELRQILHLRVTHPEFYGIVLQQR